MSTPAPSSPEVELARERTRQDSFAGYPGGFPALFAAGPMTTSPTWPVAVGVAALAGMVSVICHGILRR